MEPKRKKVDFHPLKLQTLADQLSQRYWQKKCAIPVVWNGRLTRTMGRFLFSVKGTEKIPLRIDISKHAAHFIDRQTLHAVLLHELCHYHLFIQRKPFADHHPLFEKELRRVGAISTNTVQIPQKGYQLFCSRCLKSLGTRRRMNTKHYLSACCHKKIIKEEVWLGEFTTNGKIEQPKDHHLDS